ncbi:hypothetical protein [Sphingopyxis terrae]|uniref:hypothetical protein n=1 Tax=Sphingopyxis terrae TaxID=33052 RepID=UPI003605B55B
MQLPHGAHVAVADGNRFVLFRNDGDADLINLVDAASPEVDAGNRGGAKPEPRDLDERDTPRASRRFSTSASSTTKSKNCS